MKTVIYSIITVLLLSLIGCSQRVVESQYEDYPVVYEVQNEPDASKGIEFVDPKIDSGRRTIQYLNIGGASTLTPPVQ